MLFYLFNDLVSVTRFFAEKRQDDELKISRGEHFRHPHPWPPHEARAKVAVASYPASEVTVMTVMTVAFKWSKIVMSMHVVLLTSQHIFYEYIIRYILS
jgi:hypothetical protein